MLSKRWETMTFLFSGKLSTVDFLTGTINSSMLGATISYMLRVNISVCAQKMRDELDWSEREKGGIVDG